jgi:hypothetical protein
MFFNAPVDGTRAPAAVDERSALLNSSYSAPRTSEATQQSPKDVARGSWKSSVFVILVFMVVVIGYSVSSSAASSEISDFSSNAAGKEALSSVTSLVSASTFVTATDAVGGAIIAGGVANGAVTAGTTTGVIATADNTANNPDFCWRDSIPRGVGKIPSSCRVGFEKIGLLCYPKCAAGYSRSGFDCRQNCPSGFVDDGLFCRVRDATYGRGAGSGKKKCESSYGSGACERNGLLYYPICKAGYDNDGCCICSVRLNCDSYGMGGKVAYSCAKKIIIGKVQTGECAPDEDKEAGLCYKKCPGGYTGVGPVCWGLAPMNMFKCGMGAAVDNASCAKIISNQVIGPLQIVAFGLTLGSAGAANTAAAAAKAADAAADAAKAAAAADKASKLQKAITAAEKAYAAAKPAIAVAKDAGTIAAEGALTVAAAIDTAQNIKDKKSDTVIALEATRDAMEIASLMDPTGVSATLAAYTYPKCSAYFGKPTDYDPNAKDITEQNIPLN